MRNDATADLIVIPRWRSSASVSVCVLPLSTLPTSSITPAENSRRSVRLVLPASTCARIPRLSVLTTRHAPCVGQCCHLGEHVRCPQSGYLPTQLGSSRFSREVQQVMASGGKWLFWAGVGVVLGAHPEAEHRTGVRAPWPGGGRGRLHATTAP